MDPDVAAASKAVSDGRKADAERILEAAMAKAEQQAPESPRMALILNNLSGLYFGEGRQAEAENLEERAVAIDTKLYGPTDPRVAGELGNLGTYYEASGKPEEAEKSFKRAVEIETRSPHGNIWVRQAEVGNLVGLYRRQHRYAEAQALLEHELALAQEGSTNFQDPMRAIHLRRELAQLYQAEGRPREAVRVLRQPVPPNEDVGPHDARGQGAVEAERLMALGNLAQDRGDLRAAEDYYTRAEAGLEAANGTNFLHLPAKAFMKLGELYREQGSVMDAERLFSQAFDLEDNAPHHPGSGALPALFGLQNLYRDEHRLSEINPDYERTIEEQEKDPDGPVLELLLESYARVSEEEGELERAESLYERALAIQERNLSPRDVHLANTLEGYALALDALGKRDEAAAARARAKAIRKQAGADRPR